MVNRKTSGALYRIPTLVLLLGMLSVALLIWTHEITETQRENFALVDALEHIQKRTFMFHLRLEEAISGDTKVAMDSLWGEIDDAMRVADAILNGGEVVMGLTIQRLPNPHQRAAVAEIAVALNNFKSVALQRYQRTQFGEIHSEVEQHFHDAFQEAWNKTGRFETEAEMDYVAAHASSRRLFWAILLVWTSVVVGSTVGLWSRERRRRWAETELRTANERLESQAEELRRNREQLQDLVEERTGELTTANRELRREIDERTQVEGVLRESEGKFRKLSREFNALLDAIPDRITLLAPDLKILWANRAAVQGAGSQVSDVTWHPCYKVWHGLAAPCDDCPAARSFETGRPESKRVSELGRIWDLRTFPVKTAEGRTTSVIEVATDVTERITLQAKAMRAAHLAALGELAAGVAHEINNPINGIINYAQILSNQTQEKSREHDIAARIVKEGGRIASIVNGLLSFARERKEEKEPVSVLNLISDSLGLAESQMKKAGIKLVVDLPHDLPAIIANPQQIQQVFLNIINNARYALDEKYPQAHEDKVLEITGEEMRTEGMPHVRIAFHDRGTGIPAELLDRVMMPFFSTKPGGKGTGLGLCISHGIVSDHGGTLDVESMEGEFTRATVILPAKELAHGDHPHH